MYTERTFRRADADCARFPAPPRPASPLLPFVEDARHNVPARAFVDDWFDVIEVA